MELLQRPDLAERNLDAAHSVARGDAGAIAGFAAALSLAGFPAEVTMNGQTFAKSALHYIENHDHSRFLADFGTTQPDEAGNYLFLAADRGQWFRAQPYLIAMLTTKDVPMLFQGQELAEDFTLPGNGLGRVGLLRPVNWDYFYDDPGRATVTLVRKLRIRRNRPELRSGAHWYLADSDHQNRGVLAFSRTLGSQASVVAVNFTGSDAQVSIAFPVAGTWHEQLDGTDLPTTDQITLVTVPSNYGRVWTIG